MTEHLPFRVLVVEDDDLWLDDMKSAIEETNLKNHQGTVIYCTNSTDAEKALKRNHFHIASLDQKIPSAAGANVSISTGAELTRTTRGTYPFTDICVYTGFDSTEIGAAAGDNTLILRKNAPGEEGTTPGKWARELESRLQGGYFRFYFRQAENHLPPHLASVAAFVFQALQSQQWQRCVSHGIQFWSLTLRIALAQAQGLCHHYRKHWKLANADNYAVMEQTLSTLLGRLGAERLTPWRPYIGKGGNNRGVGKTFVCKGSKPLRKIRNDLAHGSSFKPWDKKFDEMQPYLFRVMDAAAFWGSFPMATRIRQKDHGYFGQLLQGTGYPWRESPLPAPPNFQPESNHVYLRWADGNGQTEWVDLWPFIQVEFDNRLNREVIWVAGNRWKKRWFRCSLQDGKTRPWNPPDDVRKILELAE